MNLASKEIVVTSKRITSRSGKDLLIYKNEIIPSNERRKKTLRKGL
jgi:hypothetical protein